MQRLSDWCRGLAVCILLLGFLEVMLPRGNLRPYARLSLGLVLLAVLLEPLGWLRGDSWDVLDEWTGGAPQGEGRLGTAWRDGVVRAHEMALAEWLEEEMRRVGWAIEGVKIVLIGARWADGQLVGAEIITAFIEAGDLGRDATVRARMLQDARSLLERNLGQLAGQLQVRVSHGG